MRYVCTKLTDNYNVIFDRVLRKTLLLEGDFDDALRKIYEDTTFVPNNVQMNVTTFVLNTTEECNLRCKYCSRYYGNYSSKHMSYEQMKHIIDWICDYSNKIEEKCILQFHGGEPTLRWKLIKDVLSTYDRSYLSEHIDFRIQSNGTTICEELLSFCKEYDIHLGISMDGPPEITNKMRHFENGKGISEVLVQNIGLLKEKLSRNTISCLCVITNSNVQKAKEVFEFITNTGIDDLSILPLYNDYSCINDDKTIIPRNDEMADFSIKIIDLWIEKLKEKQIICMPNFQIWVWNLLASNSDTVYNCSSCCGAGETMAFIDMNGDLYPCGPFSYYPEMKICNINDLDLNNHLEDIKKRLQPLSERNIAECEDCGLQGICKKGCAANSYLHHKDISRKDPYCDYWKKVISHLLIKIIEDPELLELVPDYTIRM